MIYIQFHDDLNRFEDDSIYIHTYIHIYVMLYDGKSCQIVNFWHKTTNLTSKLIYIKFPDDLNRFEDDAMYLHR